MPPLRKYAERLAGKSSAELVKEQEAALIPPVRKARKKKAVSSRKTAPKTARKAKKVSEPKPESLEPLEGVSSLPAASEKKPRRVKRKPQDIPKTQLANTILPEKLIKLAEDLEVGLDNRMDKMLLADVKNLLVEVPEAILENEVIKKKKRRSYTPYKPRPKRTFPCHGCQVVIVDRWQTFCPSCVEKRDNNRKVYLKAQRYGLPPDFFLSLLDRQNWQCLICEIKFDRDRLSEITMDTSKDGSKLWGFCCSYCRNALARMRQGKNFINLHKSLHNWIIYESKNYPELLAQNQSLGKESA